MALDEPKLAPSEEGTFDELQGSEPNSRAKRDDAPDYYKRPKFRRNIIPFDTEDLSVRVIRERFLIPDQVKEGSPAAKAGLKLGDEIVTINGADASAMRLATAESVIKQAGEQLQLVVTKDQEEDAAAKAAVAAEPTPAVAAEPTPAPAPVENKPKETREIKFAVSPARFSSRSITRSPEPAAYHNHQCTARSPSCESCESYTNAAVVEEQLRQMQKQLNEISIIPMQIQATLSYLTKALARFAPPELQRELPVSLRSSSVRETIPEECEDWEENENMEENRKEPEVDDDDLTDCFERMFDESTVLSVVPSRDIEYEYRSEEECDDEPEVSEEERLKQEKLDRVSKLERSWPWSQTAKPIHKRSNCHLVSSIALEKSKVKQLIEENELPFYNRGYRQRFGN